MKFEIKELKELSNTLRSIQDKVIGVAKPIQSDVYEPIINKDGKQLTLINVGTLLGYSTTYISESQCFVHYFPEGKTLSQMMKDPIKFHEWWNKNIKK